MIPSAGNPDSLQMADVPTTAAMQQGDVIVTSGLGNAHGLQSLLPQGIPIGTVTSVSESDGTQVKTDPGDPVRRLPGHEPRAGAQGARVSG